MFVIFSNRLGCLGSLVVSAVLTIVLLAAMRACSGPVVIPPRDGAPRTEPPAAQPERAPAPDRLPPQTTDEPVERAPANGRPNVER